MTGDSPLKAHAPNQPFLHALREGDAPPDARTTATAITTPHPGAGCRGQRQPVPAHLVDEAVTAAAACPAPVHSGCKLCHESVRIPYGLRSEITESMESDLLHDRTSHDSIQTNSVMAQYDYGSVCHPYRRARTGVSDCRRYRRKVDGDDADLHRSPDAASGPKSKRRPVTAARNATTLPQQQMSR